ncbi:MAG: ABC transporter substrate-binding protein [Chloroflexi bacterium]|nr:ABC transporter substrate-binding protein [Chloroflexota bacterium]
MNGLLSQRVALLAGIAIGGLLAGAACAPQPSPSAGGAAPPTDQPRRGGVLALTTDNDPPSFDLHQESTTGMQHITAPAYDGLVMYDPMDPKSIVPDLAERWELTPDGRTYTFSLRKGVKFHNGNPFTAQDVKFSLDRMRDPPQGVRSPRRGVFEAVEKVEMVDDYAVKVQLKRPNSSLLANLAMGWMGMYDKEWVESKGQDAPKKEVMGTGPFKLKSFTPGIATEVERNPDYWMPQRPYLDGVKKFTIADKGTRVAALRSGQIHMLALSADDADAQKDLANQLTIQRLGGFSFSTINLNSTRKPFDDAKVRQAVMMAIDRRAALQILSQGDADLGGYLPPSGQWALPEADLIKLPGYAKDKAAELAQAKKLLDEAGYGAGFSVTITSEAAHEDLDTFVVDQLSKIGIKVEVKILESSVAYDAAAKKDFLMLPWGHAVTLDDPDAIYAEFYTCNAARNYSGICSKEADELFLKQSQTVDPVERKKLVQELEKKAVPLAGKIVLQWSRIRHGQWNFVRNYIKHPSSYSNQKQRDAWLSQ